MHMYDDSPSNGSRQVFFLSYCFYLFFALHTDIEVITIRMLAEKKIINKRKAKKRVNEKEKEKKKKTDQNKSEGPI